MDVSVQTILTFNAGSSSLRFAVFDADCARSLEGKFERIGRPEARLILNGGEHSRPLALTTHVDCLPVLYELLEQNGVGAPAIVLGPPAKEAVPVAFTASAKEARWSPASGSLLELAESRGLTPPFSCRSGTCGSCRTKIVEGEVTYHTAPSAEVDKDEALICCAVPVEGTTRLLLDL